jgi:hypothetical protein
MDFMDISMSLVALATYSVFMLVFVASIWTVFKKAGRPGWACIIPIYNVFVLLQVARRPAWWLLMFLIPCVGVPFYIITFFDIAKAFGKGTLFGFGLLLLGPIFFPILAFGSSQYQPA